MHFKRTKIAKKILKKEGEFAFPIAKFIDAKKLLKFFVHPKLKKKTEN